MKDIISILRMIFSSHGCFWFFNRVLIQRRVMSFAFYTLGDAALTQGYKYFAPTAQFRKFFLELRPVGPLGNSQVRSAWFKQGNKTLWQSESKFEII